MIDIKVGDKVRTSSSLWKGDIGEVSGIIPKYSIDDDNNQITGYLAHVIFPETDKHEEYQQTFDIDKLIKVV